MILKYQCLHVKELCTNPSHKDKFVCTGTETLVVDVKMAFELLCKWNSDYVGTCWRYCPISLQSDSSKST